MRIRCIRTEFSEAEKERFGIANIAPNSFRLTVGTEYLVLGLSFMDKSSVLGEGLCVDISGNGVYITPAPLRFFEITDPRSSRHWILSQNQAGIFCLWPQSFFQPFYHDLLSDGDASVSEDFRHTVAVLATEFASGYGDGATAAD